MTRLAFAGLLVITVVGLIFLSYSVEAAPPWQGGTTPAPTAEATVAAVSTVTTTVEATITVTATATVTATSTVTTTSSTTGGATGKIDLNAVLPDGPGRELVLQYCVGCHIAAPIAVAAKSPEGWDAQRENHSRFLQFGDDIVDKIYAYLKKYYPEDRQIPELPPEFLESWTTY